MQTIELFNEFKADLNEEIENARLELELVKQDMRDVNFILLAESQKESMRAYVAAKSQCLRALEALQESM